MFSDFYFEVYPNNINNVNCELLIVATLAGYPEINVLRYFHCISVDCKILGEVSLPLRETVNLLFGDTALVSCSFPQRHTLKFVLIKGLVCKRVFESCLGAKYFTCIIPSIPDCSNAPTHNCTFRCCWFC